MSRELRIQEEVGRRVREALSRSPTFRTNAGFTKDGALTDGLIEDLIASGHFKANDKPALRAMSRDTLHRLHAEFAGDEPDDDDELEEEDSMHMMSSDDNEYELPPTTLQAMANKPNVDAAQRKRMLSIERDHTRHVAKVQRMSVNAPASDRGTPADEYADMVVHQTTTRRD